MNDRGLYRDGRFIVTVTFLMTAILFNLVRLLPITTWAMTTYRIAYPLSLEQRRLLVYPTLFPDILRIQQGVPENATLWYVGPDEPWHVNYLLYPRTLRWGSPLLSDLAMIRSKHPSDWTIIHKTNNPREDRARVFPPVVATTK